MADFCHDCVQELFGIPGDKNDLSYADHEEYGDDVIVNSLCEGCGFGIFSKWGMRVPIEGNAPQGDSVAETHKAFERRLRGEYEDGERALLPEGHEHREAA